MGKSNQELIEKTISTSSLLNGGALNPEQQEEFIVLVRKFSTLLGHVRTVPMDQPNAEFDKMHLGEPVTESADENVDSGNLSSMKFNKVALHARKLRSAWNITTENLQLNIEQGALEKRVFEAMTERIATDLELLFISGDTTISGSDPTSRLLKRMDGIDKLSEGCHILDAGGLSIEKGIFSAAKDCLPKQYRNDPNLRWILSDSLANDWKDYLGDRGTALGDSALGGGSAIAPLGIPIHEVPLFPDEKSVTIAGATPATVLGIRQGPFEIVASGADQNNKFKVDLDNGGADTVTLTEGTWDAAEIAQMINDAVGVLIARDDTYGRLRLTSSTTGSTSELDIQAVATDAYTVLGFTAAVTTGANSAGVAQDGTFVLLCNPKNLMFGILNGTRVYSEFNKDHDRIETRVYNQVAAQIENKDAIVKIKNLRRRKRF